jgi:hypothetical protein
MKTIKIHILHSDDVLSFTTPIDTENKFNHELTIGTLCNMVKDSEEYFIKDNYQTSKSKWNPKSTYDTLAIIPKNSVSYILIDE